MSFFIGFHRKMLIGQYPFGQIVDLVEMGASDDGQLAGAPQEIESRFLRLPTPPGPTLFRVLEVRAF